MASLKHAVDNKKLAKAMFCNTIECEDGIKAESDGATSRCMPFEDQRLVKGTCLRCGKDAQAVALFGRAY